MSGGLFQLEAFLGFSTDPTAEQRLRAAADAAWATGLLFEVEERALRDEILFGLPTGVDVPARFRVEQDEPTEWSPSGEDWASLLIELSDLDFLTDTQLDVMLAPHLASIGIPMCELAGGHHGGVGWQADDHPEADAHHRTLEDLPETRWIGHHVVDGAQWLFVPATEGFGGRG